MAEPEPEGFSLSISNTNSERRAKDEKAKAMEERGLKPLPEDAPKGMRELHAIITVCPKDTPDNHGLFALVGNRFTVGGLRSLFPGVKSTRN